MTAKQLRQAAELTDKIMRIYYCQRDIYAVLDFLSPDASWIGPGEREKKYTPDAIRSYFELSKDAVPSCEVSDTDLRAVDLGAEHCLVIGSFTIRTTPSSGLLLEVDQRVSFIYRLAGEQLALVHMHTSNPYGEMKGEEYFPHEIGAQSYQYLQRLLREKTEVIDMINGNITGGLKGSNDDAYFSYFYVNEGLPRMLDMTYDEFMAQTGGTAVGAVYPPDLPSALEDCARCFAKGPVYSTEYRMEKKDGSLIWVLDSGRKVTDAEGVTRINSIITDITPLKHALFDLEVERERYRIALDNITGSMCEYEIAEDLFIVYWQTDRGSGREVEKLTFPHFSESVRSGALVHPEDGALFLDLCTGRRRGLMEFRTRFFPTNDPWRWDQFSCSVVSDSTGIPVRSIGILKDVTEETQKKMQLLNQARRDSLTKILNHASVKEAIEAYLTEHMPESTPCALLMVDLDRFKTVNDTNGHLCGDEVLIKTARILSEAAGPNSIVGRSGGDEFIVLAKGKGPAEAARLAEDINRKVNAIGEEICLFISCSIGFACQNGERESFTQLFQRADKALYRAKDGGRNQWAMDEVNPQ